MTEVAPIATPIAIGTVFEGGDYYSTINTGVKSYS